MFKEDFYGELLNSVVETKDTITCGTKEFHSGSILIIDSINYEPIDWGILLRLRLSSENKSSDNSFNMTIYGFSYADILKRVSELFLIDDDRTILYKQYLRNVDKCKDAEMSFKNSIRFGLVTASFIEAVFMMLSFICFMFRYLTAQNFSIDMLISTWFHSLILIFTFMGVHYIYYKLKLFSLSIVSKSLYSNVIK